MAFACLPKEPANEVGQTLTHAGYVCISLGLLVNEVTLERTIVPDGRLTSVPLRIFVVGGQLFLVGLGLFLLVKQPRIPVVKIVVVSSSTLFAVLVGTVTLQGLYEPTPIKSGWRSLPISKKVHELEKNQLGFVVNQSTILMMTL